MFPSSSSSSSSSSNQNPIMQSSSSTPNQYPIPEPAAYSDHNPITESCSSPSCFCRSSRIVQNRPSQTPTFGLHYPSYSNGLSSSHQDLDSLFSRLDVSDRGSSNLLLRGRPPSPSVQFDNEALYHSYPQQHLANEIENRIRMQEVFAPQMPSSYTLSPRIDYHQSMASTQFRNPYEFCPCCSAFSSSLQSDYNTRRGSTSNSMRRYSGRNRPALSSDSMYNEFGNSGRRRIRMSAANFDSGLENFRSLIVQLAKDQEGCRYLQKKIEGGMASDIEIILSEVKDRIPELMSDAFGNYFVQRLFEVCSEEQRTEIILVVTKDEYELVSICLDLHGTRAVQKLLELLTTPNQINLVISALRPGTITLINNQHGHHVIERCLQNFSHEYIKCLTDKIADNCVEVAMHQHGCCVLQKCLGRSEGEQRERLLSEIIVNALHLSQDQYGNYVVQFVLELGVPNVTAGIVDQLEGNYASLSMQKYSSNVVEKCLKWAQEEQSTRIIRELLESPYAVLVMENNYGNYVMQSALKVSKGPIHLAIVSLIEREKPSLRSNPYGKRVVDCINLKKGGSLQENRAPVNRKAALHFY